MIVSKSNVELDLMREAGQIVAVQGALPSFKGYITYPASIVDVCERTTKRMKPIAKLRKEVN